MKDVENMEALLLKLKNHKVVPRWAVHKEFWQVALCLPLRLRSIEKEENLAKLRQLEAEVAELRQARMAGQAGQAARHPLHIVR